MTLCSYSNSLGYVGKGIHSYRIFNVAYMDVIGTIIVSYILSLYVKIPFVYILTILLLIGIILHRLFCVRTTVDKILFPRAR
jgi:uncharacterized membrane protein YcaP (DUF421 family)